MINDGTIVITMILSDNNHLPWLLSIIVSLEGDELDKYIKGDFDVPNNSLASH